MVHALLLIPLVALLTSKALAYTITHTSLCDFSIWIGAWQDPSRVAVGVTGETISPAQAGSAELTSGSSWTQSVPTNWVGGRVWAREDCRTTGSSFECSIGDCGGEQCTADSIGSTSADQTYNITLVEFTTGDYGASYGGMRVTWDISRAQGWNVGVSVSSSDGSTASCEVYDCPLEEAFLEDNDSDVAALRNSATDASYNIIWCPSASSTTSSTGSVLTSSSSTIAISSVKDATTSTPASAAAATSVTPATTSISTTSPAIAWSSSATFVELANSDSVTTGAATTQVWGGGWNSKGWQQWG